MKVYKIETTAWKVTSSTYLVTANNEEEVKKIMEEHWGKYLRLHAITKITEIKKHGIIGEEEYKY